MGFKKGNQNIDSVFYGTDYVERMYLGGEQFFQASYLDFYKTNFFSIGLGQKKQIDNPKGDGAISYIKTEWSSQYGYQLEVNQASTGRSTNYTDAVFKEKFSFMLPEGKYLLKLTKKNISSVSTGDLRYNLFEKDTDESILPNKAPVRYETVGISVKKDTEVYLGMFINDFNVGETSIFSLELSPAKEVNGKFTEASSLMVRGRKKEIYNSSVSSINITIPETAFYSGKEYPVEYIDSDAFNYEVTENGKTVSQPLTKISKIAVEGDNMIGFGNRAFKNCSSCTSFSCTSSAFQGGLFANNAAFEGCGALNSLTLSIVKNINGLRESQNLKSIVMGGRGSYSFDQSFAGNTSIETIHWKNKDSFGAEKAFTANFGPESFKGCTNLKTIVSNDFNSILGEDTVFSVGTIAFAGCTSLIVAGTGFGSNTGPLYSYIDTGAFRGCTGLTSVDFGTREGAKTKIGLQAFENCTGITSINLPNTVTSIGYQAFKGCSSLETINIPFIGESATSTNNKFSYIFGTVPTSLKTVGFSEGNNITKIPDGAFRDCSGLTSITIPNTVISIGASAFYGCSGLTSITIPVGVTSIGNSAFRGCSGLTSITIPNSVTSIGDSAFIDCSGLTSITIPNSVTSIGNTVFMDCRSLKSINIPNGVTSIGDGAFYGCSGLTSVNIPNSVTSIGANAFYGCSGLTSLTTPADFLSSFDKTNLRNVTVTKGNIPNNAFNNCTNLTTVILNGGETSIGDSAFQGCSGLTSITIPNTVISIGAWAFEGCSSLTSVTIPNSVTSIGWRAFADCSGLTSITIPDSVTSIVGDAFAGCSNLTSITTSAEHLSRSELPLTTIKSLNITKGEIPNEALKGCANLTDLTIGEGVTSIGSSAFYACSGLTSITIPVGVTRIGEYAFFNCSGLTSITIPDSVTKIDDGVFDGCSSLTSIIIPGSVKSIGISAFWGCSGLTSIIIPSSVTSIGNRAFQGCSGLTSITIPNSVTYIGEYAFKDCNSLTIYAEAATKPAGWNVKWNPSMRPVVWGYQG